MALNTDKLLVQKADFSVIRDPSDGIKAERIDPFTREAQVREIRSFLGDELYLELLDRIGTVIGGYNFERHQANFVNLANMIFDTRGFVVPSGQSTGSFQNIINSYNLTELGTNTLVQVFLDVETTFSGQIDIVMTTIGDGFAADFTWQFTGTGLQGSNSQTMVAGTASTYVVTITPTAGSFDADVIIKSLRFVSSTTNVFGDLRIMDLFEGKDYLIADKEVRFNGLQYALLYWAWARFLANQQQVVGRYGIRELSDSPVSIRQQISSIRKSKIDARGMALMYQADTDTFIEENNTVYPEFENRPITRQKETTGFKFEKI